MKVLYIGHYRENSGWGHSAIDYILAMDRAGIEVVPRAVKLGISPPELPQRLLDLENHSSAGCDICIQHVLPHLMDYNGHFKKNIAIYTSETDSFTFSSWPSKLNTMDEVWVSCGDMHEAAMNSGIKVPIQIVSYPSDMAKFEKEYQPLDIPPIDGDFVFYFIGDLTRRKNLIALVKAFHMEFVTSEPVSLVIKASKHGLSEQQNSEEIMHACNQIKEQLKLYGKPEDYKSEIIITQHLTEEKLAELHCACDCFVMPSFGEAWCIPAFDAMGFGNPIIATNTGGLKEFITPKVGILINGYKEPVFGMKDTFHDLFTAREQWVNIDITALQAAMRRVYEDELLYRDLSIDSANYVYEFSYETIGQKIKELLCQQP